MSKDGKSLFAIDKKLDETHNFLQDSLNIPLNNSDKEANKWKEWANNNLNPFNKLMQPNGNISDLRGISTGFDKSKVLNDIKSNTDDIKRNTDFSKYLRELADRQSVNHFTSPTYNVKFDAQNTINSKSDIDDIVHNFSEQLRNALMNSTQGVYQSHGGAFA